MGMGQKNIHKNLLGNRYGRLQVVGQVPYIKGSRQWLCLCDCGTTRKVYGTNLTFGHSTSCGCLAKELTRVRNSRAPGLAGFNGLRNNYRRGAMRRGFSWELTTAQCSDFFARNCVYCGIEPKQRYLSGSANGTFYYNGLDRVDNTIGYTETNTVPCCKICNLAKGTMSYTDFLTWVQRVHKNLNLCDSLIEKL